MSEALSERDLEAIEKSAHGYRMGVERYGDRAYGRERDIEDMVEEMLLLVSEIRRSHTEAAELRERVEDLSNRLADVIEKNTILTLEMAGKRTEVERLQERVESLKAALFERDALIVRHEEASSEG